MKTIKTLSSLLIASAFLVGCSDDDVELNSANCTVGFQTTEVTVKENADLFNIPIVVEGDQNGVVNVVLSVEEYGDSPAKEDVNYYITDKTLTISSEDKQIGLEVFALDDEEINESRKFIVKIASADGAQLDESRSAVVVTLKDNDSNFYDKLAGKWAFTAGKDAANAKLVPYAEGDPKYENEFVLVIERQGVPMQFTMNYSFDLATKKIKLSMPVGEMIAEGLDFGDPVGVCDVYSSLVVGEELELEGNVEWVLSDDMKTIKANTDSAIVGALFATGTKKFTGYTWFGFANAMLKR